MPKVGRNDPCPCGSGKKYKKCCELKEYAEQQKAIQEENEAWEAWFKKDCEEGQRNLVEAEMKKYVKELDITAPVC